jgi:chromosome partitioning protein
MNDPTRLEEFYRSPTPEVFKQLSDPEFHAFLERLFALAGYQVKRSGSALFLSVNEHLVAVAQIGYATTAFVGNGPIQQWMQSLQQHTYPFDLYVTRTDFTDPARAAIGDDSSLVLLSGDQMIRFYLFLRDSRLQGEALPPMSLDLMTLVDATRHVYAEPPRVLVVANNRGGIGKSTTALNMAYGLSKLGKSVLAIDLDPQANFTEMLGGQRDTLIHAHIGQYFAGNTELPPLVQRSPVEGILYLAAHPDMSKAMIDPGRWPHAQMRFAALLRHPTIAHHPQAKGGKLDWIVIDTPPDMGFYTHAALMSANLILVPTFPSSAGNNGVQILINSAQVRNVLIGSSKHGNFVGFLATRYSERNATASDKQDNRVLRNRINALLAAEAIALAGKQIFVPASIPDTPTVVSVTRDLVKTTRQGHSFPVFEKEGMGKNEVGAAYKALVEEVVKRASII